MIRPCGLDPDAITSMEKLAGRPVDLVGVKKTLVRNFATVFGVTTTEVARSEAGKVILAHGKD